MVDVTAETTVRAALPFFTHAVIRDESLMHVSFAFTAPLPRARRTCRWNRI
jgi:hypothetical protein